MSRSVGISKQRTPVIQEPPRGPGRSIASAQNIVPTPVGKMTPALFAQQQALQQQYLKQQEDMKNMSQRMVPETIPQQVTVQQAVAVIVARLNNLESKMRELDMSSSPEQSDSPNELDLAIAQIFERLQILETEDASSERVHKLESDLRDAKDAVFKLQTCMISNTDQINKLTSQVAELSAKCAIKESGSDGC
jgi:hypothetical protein